jgi:reticulon-4-interacting protein 1, mitochondrial
MQSELQVMGAGPALRLASRRVAAPGKRELQIQVLACSVNPIDAKRAHGYGRRLLSVRGAADFPRVMGNDFAGRVVAGGGGTSTRTGQYVYGMLPVGPRGSHATVINVDERWVRVAPASADLEALAVLPYSFTTMFQALRTAGLSAASAAGKRVLVHGAGALGLLAVQFLRRWSAHVTLIGGHDARDRGLSMGAQQVLNRHELPFSKLRPEFDATLNFAAWKDEAVLLSCLSEHALGHAATVHPLLENFDQFGWLGGARRTLKQRAEMLRHLRARSRSASYGWVIARPDAEALDAMHSMVSRAQLCLPIGIRRGFEGAVDVFSHVSEGRSGRGLLLPEALA